MRFRLATPLLALVLISVWTSLAIGLQSTSQSRTVGTQALAGDRFTSILTSGAIDWSATVDPAIEPEIVLDFPLESPIDIELIRRVVPETLRIGFEHPDSVAGSVDFALTSSGETVVQAVATFWGSQYDGDFYTISIVDIDSADLASATSTIVDGVRLEISLSPGASATGLAEIEVQSLRSDGRLEVHFAPCEFGPCGPNRDFVVDGLPNASSVTFGGVLPWQPDVADSRAAWVGDLNDDGATDVYVANWGKPGHAYLGSGIGSAEFGAGQLPQAFGLGNGANAGDFDGDGHLDVVETQFFTPIKLLLGNGVGAFIEAPGAFGTVGQAGVDPEPGDLDGDGDLDVFLGATSVDRVWLNDGAGLFSELSGAVPAVVAQTHDVVLADVDDDGDLDALCLNRAANGENQLYLNDGAATFAEAPGSIPTDSVRCYAGELADFDADGDLDAAVSTNGAPLLWLNDGTGTFADASASLPALTPGIGLGLAVGDVDGDADLDIAIGKSGLGSQSQSVLLLNDGAGAFSDATPSLPVDESETSDIVFLDADADADLDLFLANDGLNRLWLNDGGGVFTVAATSLPEADDYYRLPEAVPGDGLALIGAGGWLWTSAIPATVNLEMRLDNGTYLRLDDWQSPSDDTAPTGPSVVSSFVLQLTPEQREQLAQRWIVGWRWRIVSESSLATVDIGSATIEPKIFFLYDEPGCAGQSAPSVAGLDPASGSEVAAPGSIVLQGELALPSGDLLGAAVTLNGVPVEVVDAAGRFFVEVDVVEGQNTYVLGGVQAGCGEALETYELVGVAPETLALDNFGDVSTSVEPHYFNTTFSQVFGQLMVDVFACNVGGFPLAEGVRMVITDTSDPSIFLVAPDGFTEFGEPFLWLDELDGDGVLSPLECTEVRKLAFATPLGLPVDFDVRWEVPASVPPVFTSLPIVTGFPDQVYTYDADAFDANGHQLAYALQSGPSAMAIDPLEGLVSWTPTASELGLTEVEVRATDPFGTSAFQRFTLEIGGPEQNQAPYFVSTPNTQAGVAVPWNYDADAFDPNGGTLTYSLSGPPAGMAIDGSTGLVTWDFPLNGTFPITVIVEDALGAAAEQNFTLAAGVLSPNPTIPTLFGSPSGVAVVDQEYLYQPVVGNLDPDEIATFALDASAPPGMEIDVVSGRITWIPSAADVGTQAAGLTVDDGQGGNIGQTWTIEVFEVLPNQPPIILSTPDLVAIDGEPYFYTVIASDPDGTTPTYELQSGPAGMWMEAGTGVVFWAEPALGSWTVAVRANDFDGLYGAQVFELEVVPVNTPPTITSGPPIALGITGGLYQHQVTATDPDGQELDWSLDEAPAGMQIHPQTGLISWTPAAPQFGVYTVAVRVEDGFGGAATQSFDVDVDLDVVPPSVTLTVTPLQVAPGGEVQACVLGGDDVSVAIVTMSVDGTPLIPGPSGCAVFELVTAGTHLVRAEVVDGGGNLEFQEVLVSVIQDPLAPTIDIASVSPEKGASITSPVEIRATIDDPDTPELLVWEVRVRRDGDDDYTVIGSGSGPTVDGVIADFDPTLLANDLYDVEIIASDGALEAVLPWEYFVEGALKLGNAIYLVSDFELDFLGLPLTIARRYDSIEDSSGDFGNGWHLQLPGDLKDTASEPDVVGPLSFGELYQVEPFVDGTKVYVTLPSGQRESFTFRPESAGFALLAVPQFEPDNGYSGNLEAVGPSLIWNLGLGFFDFIVPYNPVEYVLVDAQGVEFHLSEDLGLTRAVGPFGDELVVTSDAIASSTGVSVEIVRGVDGRIEQVIRSNDGADEIYLYGYDRNGRLAEAYVPGVAGPRWTYEYDGTTSKLVKATNADGVVSFEAAWGLDGRLTQVCSSISDSIEATCSTFIADPGAMTETLVSFDGVITAINYDELGNPVQETVTLPGEGTFVTMREFEDSRLVLEVLPDGATNEFVYVDGRLVKEVLFDGGVITREYGDCDKVVSITYPGGETFRYEYDDECRLQAAIQPDGTRREVDYGESGLVETYRGIDGSEWTFTWGSLGITQVDSPSGGTLTVDYDSLGRPSRIVDPVGDVRELTFNADGNLLLERWNLDPSTDIVYVYSDGGRVVTVSSPGVQVDLDYWSNGFLKSEVSTGSGIPGELNWTSDPPTSVDPFGGSGIPRFRVDGAGGIQELELDSNNRVTRAEFTAPGTTVTHGWIFGYSGEAYPSSVDFVDPLDSVIASLATNYACGCAARPQSIDLTGLAGPTSSRSWSFTYDSRGRRAGFARGETDLTVARDAVGRILEVSDAGAAGLGELFAFDSDGALTESSAAGPIEYVAQSNGGKLVSGDAEYTYEFDVAGQLVARVRKSDGEVWLFDWSPRAVMERAERRDSAGGLMESIDFEYDGLGRLFRRTSSAEGTAYYGYVGIDRLFELDASGQVTRRYVLLPGVGAVLGEWVSGIGLLWNVRDEKSDLLAEVDTSGSLVSSPVYSAYGIRVDSGPEPLSDRGWRALTPYVDGVVVDMRTRGYLPRLGLFTAVDPIYPFGYEYGSWDPWTFTDPLGQASVLGTALLNSCISLVTAAGYGFTISAGAKALGGGFKKVADATLLAGGALGPEALAFAAALRGVGIAFEGGGTAGAALSNLFIKIGNRCKLLDYVDG